MKKPVKLLVLLSIIAVFSGSVLANLVPNGDFELLYKPGTTITGQVSSGGWTQGVGPECPIDNGSYEFSDGTTGAFADIPGWIGYDRDGWVANGGSYGRDETTGNLQGAISSQHNHTPDGSQGFIVNGGSWGNPAGGLITSEASLGGLTSGIYTISVFAKGKSTPIVFDLLANGIVLIPDEATNPELTGDWQEYTRTYDLTGNAGLLGSGLDLTIVLGIDRGAVGTQTQFDDVSMSYVVPEPATMVLLGIGGLGLLRRRRNG